MCNFWRAWRDTRSVAKFNEAASRIPRGETVEPMDARRHVCRKEERMSTTFKDGLREHLANAAAENCSSALAAQIRGNRAAQYLSTSDAAVIASAALAYCDQWEEVSRAFWCNADNRTVEGTATILVRKAPVPTRAERLGPLLTEAREAMFGMFNAQNANEVRISEAQKRMEQALDAVRAAAKEDR